MERDTELAVFVITQMVCTRANLRMGKFTVMEDFCTIISFTTKASGSLAKSTVLAKTFISMALKKLLNGTRTNRSKS